jgi:hypothetical protein
MIIKRTACQKAGSIAAWGKTGIPNKKVADRQRTKNELMKKMIFIGTLMALSYVPFVSFGWGMLGHRVIGQIAENHLSKKAKKAISEILGSESVAMASTYADFIKSDSNYKYIDSWHYINFKAGLSYEGMQEYLKTDETVDAYTKMQYLITELKKKDLEQKKKVFYLKLLIHIAGDVHQPMHSTAEGDKGGNDVKVQWAGQPSNLHRVWDSDLIESQQLSYTEYAASLDHATPQELSALKNEPIGKWLYDSYTISAALRAQITEPNQRLGYNYTYEHLATANRRMLEGGIHLAALLNEIFG